MQKRCFILAAGPLPNEDSVRCQTAYGLRTWQFLSTLPSLKDWTVRLVLLSSPNHYEEAPEFKEWQKLRIFDEELECLHLDKNAKGFWRRLKAEYASFNPEVCLGINNLPAYCLAKLKPQVPFWADLNGWVMAEGQSAAHVHESNAYLHTLWKREATILQRADHFSVVSGPQKLALYGELAALGRLNQWTDEEKLITVVPNANELPSKKSDYKLDLPEDAFKVLFSGSYNTWLDEETLFEGVDAAMEKNPKLHFVSTGGELEGEGNPVFRNFYKRTKKSKNKARYHFLGWLKTEELHALYSQVDLGILIDRDNSETQFGARNRINEWIQHKLPVLSTPGTELCKRLNQANALLAVPFASPKALTDALLDVTPHQLEVLAENAKAYTAANFSTKQTVAPLLEWLKETKRAADAGQKSAFQSGFLSKLRFRMKKDGVFFLFKWLWRKLF